MKSSIHPIAFQAGLFKTENDFFLSSFHDSFFWYAKTLDTALKDGVGLEEGFKISNRLSNGSFQGIAGRVTA